MAQSRSSDGSKTSAGRIVRTFVLAHGLKKEGKVPDADINRAIRRKNAFERAPEVHLYEEDDRGEDSQDT